MIVSCKVLLNIYWTAVTSCHHHKALWFFLFFFLVKIQFLCSQVTLKDLKLLPFSSNSLSLIWSHLSSVAKAERGLRCSLAGGFLQTKSCPVLVVDSSVWWTFLFFRLRAVILAGNPRRRPGSFLGSLLGSLNTRNLLEHLHRDMSGVQCYQGAWNISWSSLNHRTTWQTEDFSSRPKCWRYVCIWMKMAADLLACCV